MKNNISILILIILVALGSLSAYSLNQYSYGQEMKAFDATTLAMSNTGSAGAHTPFGIVLNANNLFSQKGKFGFQFTNEIIKIDEKRSIPMYNSFNAYINESTYASQANLYWNAGFSTYFVTNVTKNDELGFSLYYQPRYSFLGDYDEEVRNNRNSNDDGYPELIADNTVENRGTLNAYGFALAFKGELNNCRFAKSVAFGVNIEYLLGESESKKEINWTDWAHQETGYGSLVDFHQTNTRDLDGLKLQLGYNIEINSRATVALTFSPKTTINVDGDFSKNGILTYQDSFEVHSIELTGVDSLKNELLLNDYDLPSTLKFALQIRPRNVLKTVVNFEVEYVKWSETNNLFDDEYNYYVGVEHKIIETVPVRAGFSQTSSYQIVYDDEFVYANRIQTPTVSFGTGIDVSKCVRADLGFAYSFKKFETLDLFMDSYYDHSELWPNTHISLADRGWENPDTVKENSFDLMFSLTYDF